MTRKPRVLVTGASGFVGLTTVRFLANSGYEVVALSHKNELSSDLKNICFDVIRADVTDSSISDDVFYNVDAICHLAAYIPENYTDLSYAEKCYRVNALGTYNIASKAVMNKVKRFIYISTANMYNFSCESAFETDIIFPVGEGGYYFVSKLAGEIYLSNLCYKSHMNGLILRIGTPYGPGEPKNKLIPSLLSRAMKGDELLIYYGGEPNYNFIYIEDVATYIEKAIRVGRPGIYNISSGESTTLRQVGETIVSFFDTCQLKILNGQFLSREVKGFTPVSVDKAFQTWDFQPRTLKNGIHDYLQIIQDEFEKK